MRFDLVVAFFVLETRVTLIKHMKVEALQYRLSNIGSRV